VDRCRSNVDTVGDGIDDCSDASLGPGRLLDRVSWYTLRVHADQRGSLTAFETGTNVPFDLNRFFIVRMPEPGVPRAEHACSAEHLIMVLEGRAAFELDDGRDQATLELTPGDRALRVGAGVWLRMVGREPGTLLLVAASTVFAETQYFRTPQQEAATVR
jgi:WxcM-like, C-terminal